MKKTVISLMFACLVIGGAYGQSGTLFIYEESNENIDPWLDLFRIGFKERNIPYKEASAAEVSSIDPDSYDKIILYGTVMAFTFKEPVRDWLKSGPDLSGKNVSLFVTCNRWFLEKYTGQLQNLLSDRGAEIADAVTSATNDLSGDEKRFLVDRFLENSYSTLRIGSDSNS